MSFGMPDRLLVDGGTTTTRVWAARGTEILAEARATVGARDTARDGSKDALHGALARLVDEVTGAAQVKRPDWTPTTMVAAGMITSPLGLAEVPHVPAPAGLGDLAAASRTIVCPEVCALPVLLVPGVRCGPARPTPDEIASFDVMRGEEVVCLGLAATGQLPVDGLAMSVGSHWKLVGLDQSRITTCSTTLGGELLHVLRTQTVLAASVLDTLPDVLDADDLRALEQGLDAGATYGIARAGFMTRLLERVDDSSPRSRLLFLLGVVIGDIRAHWECELDHRGILFIGAPAIATAWRHAIDRAGGSASVAAPDAVVAAYVAALDAIASMS